MSRSDETEFCRKIGLIEDLEYLKRIQAPEPPSEAVEGCVVYDTEQLPDLICFVRKNPKYHIASFMIEGNYMIDNAIRTEGAAGYYLCDGNSDINLIYAENCEMA